MPLGLRCDVIERARLKDNRGPALVMPFYAGYKALKT